MSNKGCNNCAHYKRGEIKIRGPDIPRSCSLGNTEALNNWWADNGSKPPDKAYDMDCFEESEVSKNLQEVSGLLDKLNEVLNEHPK